MKIYTGRAFTYPEKIDDKEILGNPASVCVFEENENFPSKEEMSRIAIREAVPMTAFLKQKKTNFFDIQYFAPSGDEFNFCGHASLVAIQVIKQHFDFERAFLYPLKIQNLEINAVIDNTNLARINIPIYKLQQVEPNINYINGLNILIDDVIECFYCKELKDYIIKVKNNKILRNIQQNKIQLSSHLKEDGVRGLFVTSQSDNANINYEVRIFAPHVNIDEDISCGSANCSLMDIWKSESTKEYIVLCPYKLKDKIGGYEIIDYDGVSAEARVGGYIL